MSLFWPTRAVGARSVLWADAVVLLLCLLTTAATFAAISVVGVEGYLLPIAVVLLVAFAYGARNVLSGASKGLIGFVFIVVLALDLSFRSRAAGETGLDWQNGMKLVAWAFMLVIGVWYRARLPLVASDPAVLLAAAFCAFCSCSSLWSPVPAYTFACSVGAWAWFSLAYSCATRLSAGQLLKAITIALFLECLIGFAVALVMPDVGWLQDFDTDGVRLAGLSGHPNLLGQHAALLLITAAAAYEERVLKKFWFHFILAVAFITLLLTASRTAILAVIAAFACVSLRDRRRIASVVLPAALLIVGTLLLLKATDLLPNFDALFTTLSRSGDATEITTATNRSELWAIAWGHFLERPLLGWGFNGTEQLMVESVESNFAGNPVNAHSLFFQALMSFGVVGSSLVFGYLGILAWRFFMNPDRFRDRLLVFSLVLGIGEAELLSIPVVMSFLIFWCIFRDATKQVALPRSTETVSAGGPGARLPSVLLWHWGRAGAGTKFTLELANALARNGREPCCISAADETELAARAAIETPVAVRMVPSPAHRARRGALLMIKRCFGSVRAFRETLEETRPDVALCTMQTIWDLAAVSALRRFDIRYVLILHDAWFRVGDSYPMRSWALRRQIAASDGLIVLSDHVGAVAHASFGYPVSRMATIPHGAFDFKGAGEGVPRRRDRAKPLRLLFLGRIVTYKGLGLLLDAYELLRARGTQVTLDICGSGDVTSLRQQLDGLPGLQLQNRWLSEDDIGVALRDCDVVVLPYIEATQSGIAAAAFAAACPVVATPVGGLSEQVSHEKTGLVAAAVTPQALAASIERLCDDDALFARLSVGAFEHARDDLSWDQVARKTCAFLDKICLLPARRRRSGRPARIAADRRKVELTS